MIFKRSLTYTLAACPDQRRVPVPDEDDDGEEGQQDPEAGDADGQDGKHGAVPHVLHLHTSTG